MKTIQEMRKDIVLAAYKAGEGHIVSAFSILDILYVLYNGILGPDDRFILSKGHASLALYAVLGLDLSDFGQYNSLLGGHPDRNKVKGVLASTGSLGHGLPQAVGVALAKKIKNAPGRVYCLIGDGECNEGSIWESCLLAAHHKLDNLCVIVDYNHSNDRSLKIRNISDSLFSFGFGGEFINGHDEHHLFYALTRPIGVEFQAPYAIVAETIKGKGCKRMENDPAWHHRVPTAEELPEILEELNA
jgi:transketolase